MGILEGDPLTIRATRENQKAPCQSKGGDDEVPSANPSLLFGGPLTICLSRVLSGVSIPRNHAETRTGHDAAQ
jgi:hypothetical protein